jgi:hypothetical protein
MEQDKMGWRIADEQAQSGRAWDLIEIVHKDQVSGTWVLATYPVDQVVAVRLLAGPEPRTNGVEVETHGKELARELRNLRFEWSKRETPRMSCRKRRIGPPENETTDNGRERAETNQEEERLLVI